MVIYGSLDGAKMKRTGMKVQELINHDDEDRDKYSPCRPGQQKWIDGESCRGQR